MLKTDLLQQSSSTYLKELSSYNAQSDEMALKEIKGKLKNIYNRNGQDFSLYLTPPALDNINKSSNAKLEIEINFLRGEKHYRERDKFDEVLFYITQDGERIPHIKFKTYRGRDLELSYHILYYAYISNRSIRSNNQIRIFNWTKLCLPTHDYIFSCLADLYESDIKRVLQTSNPNIIDNFTSQGYTLSFNSADEKVPEYEKIFKQTYVK